MYIYLYIYIYIYIYKYIHTHSNSTQPLKKFLFLGWLISKKLLGSLALVLTSSPNYFSTI